MSLKILLLSLYSHCVLFSSLEEVVNRPNAEQKTPLRFALINNSKPLIDLLLSLGADPTRYEQTPHSEAQLLVCFFLSSSSRIQGPVEDLLMPSGSICTGANAHSETNEPMFQRLQRLGIRCDTFRNGNTILHMLCKCVPCSYCFRKKPTECFYKLSTYCSIRHRAEDVSEPHRRA